VLEGRLRSFGGGFRIKANNVVVSGFTIKGSDFGVEAEDSANVILKTIHIPTARALPLNRIQFDITR